MAQYRTLWWADFTPQGSFHWQCAFCKLVYTLNPCDMLPNHVGKMYEISTIIILINFNPDFVFHSFKFFWTTEAHTTHRWILKFKYRSLLQCYDITEYSIFLRVCALITIPCKLAFLFVIERIYLTSMHLS